MKTKHLNLRDRTAEMFKCCDDPIYFYSNYMYVQHPVRGSILFVPYPTQEKTLKNYNDYRLNMTRGARQMGTTTLGVAHILWLIVTKSDEDIMIVADKHANAQDILQRIRYALEMLPDWLRPEPTVNNKMQMHFDNGTTVQASVANECACRGKSISFLLWDGASYTPEERADAFWTAVLPNIATGGDAVISTTGSGLDINHTFNKLWTSNQFRQNRMVWDEHPYRNEDFRKDQISIIGERKWIEEYECSYIVTP